MSLTPDAIAKACRCPLNAVSEHWPSLCAALDELGVRSDLVEVAIAATTAVETAHRFEPIHEFGGPSYWTRMYEHRGDLGNVVAGDGALYHGRGFVQLTGRGNYRKLGEALGLPLEDHPDLALEASPAARVMAWFFAHRGVTKAAEAHDWRRTRLLVNGGYNGWDDYNRCVCALLEVLGA